MKILGIETSCDETAASVVKNGNKILSNVFASSADLHKITGGIIPEQAARQQIKSIIPIIKRALSDAKTKPNEITSIAVTSGPGLVGSLLVGVETAKTLSFIWNKPIIPVNHLIGHIYANWLEQKTPPQFPLLSLVVSGGHTDLVLMSNHHYHKNSIKWIGGTRDDAAGEAFDKSARLLGLPYPGGPAIAKIADEFIKLHPKSALTLFPRPMINENNFDMSFSGLKTAIFRYVDKKDNQTKKDKLAAEIQEAIVDVLTKKTLRAISLFQPKSFLLAGGVAANNRLRQKFELAFKNLSFEVDFFVPPPKLCTDNAAYIASCAFYNNISIPWQKVSPYPQLTIVGEK